AKTAGIDFLNRYYPAFLNQPLKFAMIRYGPAGITAADYDNDGFYDLFIPDGVESKLFRNKGDGTFEDVTARAGLAGLDGVGVGELGLCLGTVWGDYDGDGFLDLYVVNDFGRKTLYHNNRNGTFTDVTVKSGTLAYGAGMSASFADYDNDGKLDIYSTNIRSEHAWFAELPTVGRHMLNTWRRGVWASDLP